MVYKISKYIGNKKLIVYSFTRFFFMSLAQVMYKLLNYTKA